MSFDKRADTVEEGDTVVLYFGRQNVNPIEINRNHTFQSKFGAFHHRDIIGKKYGCKMQSKKGWGYLLRPTPELWTVTLPHRTQILYTMDISMITMELDLRPGSVVVESGTGSGSLSHALIRTIKPNGHLYTFDFHQIRVSKAKEEFEKHFGEGKYVTCAFADACVDGFGLVDTADAVFLDLPTPWDAIPHAKTALKKSGGRICSFSPCIEQVQRTSIALRQHKFCEVKTVEVLVRSLVVQTVPIPEMTFDRDTSKLEQKMEEATEATDANQMKPVTDNGLECENNTVPAKDTSTVELKLEKETEANEIKSGTDGLWKENNCSPAKATSELEGEEKTETEAKRIKLETDNGPEGENNTSPTENGLAEHGPTENGIDNPKPLNGCAIADQVEQKTADKTVQTATEPTVPCTTPTELTGLNSVGMITKKVNFQQKKGMVNMVTCKPTKEVTGHTGYLTFASLLSSSCNT